MTIEAGGAGLPPVRGGPASVAGVLVALAALVAPVATIAAEPPGLREVLATTPADSLPAALRSFEARRPRGPEGTEAVLMLGHLHYARGEYRRAAEAFARAAARLEPGRKPEARYWAGLSWLALREPNQARAALDEVVTAGGARRAEAMLAQAQAWELAQRPARALETLGLLLDGDPGEAGPAGLDRAAALAGLEGRSDEARRTRERLIREYPRSIEAAAARRTLFGGGGQGDTGPGAAAVVIGSFVDPARARALASAARAAGFADAQVVSRGQGLSAVHVVRLGVYPRSADARRAGEQAEQALGVTFELVKAR